MRKATMSLFVVCLLLAMSLLPKFVCLKAQYIEPYSYSSSGLAQQYLYDGTIKWRPYIEAPSSWQEHANGISERPASSVLLITLSLCMGVSVDDLALLPVTGLIFILLFFVFAKTFSDSHFVVYLSVITLSFDSLINMTTFNIYYIAYGFNLLAVFLILYIKMLGVREGTRTYPALLLVIFLASYFSYYTAELMSIAFASSITAVTLILQKKKAKASTLPLIFLIVFIAFDQVFGLYLSWRPWTNGPTYFREIANYFFNFLTSGTIAVQQRGLFIGNINLVYVEFMLRTLLILPILTYLALRAIRFLKAYRLKGKTGFGFNGTVFTSLILVVVADLIVYINLGVVDYRGFYLFFPLLAFSSIERLRAQLRRKKILARAAPLLIVASLLIPILTSSKFLIGMQEQSSSLTSGYYDLMKPSTSWAASNINYGAIITNYHTAGLLFERTIFSHKGDELLIYFLQFDEVIDALASKNVTQTDEYFRRKGYSYALLSTEMQTKVTYIGAWAIEGRVAPLGPYTFTFNNFTIFNKIYDDGRGLLYVHNGIISG